MYPYLKHGGCERIESRIYERTELLVMSLFLLNTLLPKLFSSSASMASSSSGESSWTSSLSSA